MDFDENALGLSPEQTEKIIQFQDLTGIEDMSICRDVLQRHQWDLEVKPFVYVGQVRAIDFLKYLFFLFNIRICYCLLFYDLLLGLSII